MSYCLHPDCCAPFNPAAQKICRNCGSKLLLKVRYRADRPISQGQFIRLFQGIDTHFQNHPLIIKQVLLPKALLREARQRKLAIEILHETSEKLSRLAEVKNLQIPLEYIISGQGIYWIEAPIQGETLTEILATLPYLSETQVQKLLQDVLPAMDALHRQSLVHRAICPDNLIYTSHTGQFMLANLGLTQLIAEALYAEIPSLSKATIAEPMYLAPEQLKGRSVPASDLYSLGVVCLQALTGIEPIHLVDQGGKIWHYRDFLRDRPINYTFCQILDKMLSPNLINRFLRAEEVLRQLSAAQSALSEQNRATAPLEPVDVFSYLFNQSAKTVADCVQSIQIATSNVASFFLSERREE
jgi:serine/threonine protein kinase